MEIVLPGDMTVRESHDIALELQHKIEGLEEVERAFVHVDHEKRDGLEHKIERELVTGALKDVVVLDNDTTVNPVLFQNELRSRVTSSNLNDANI
uniref:Cation efflux protein cytoplasmic domain-containing protein n=2 Tax=Spumella elongata TaxID=89044 RepID=A0A7S3H046_9STRA